MRKWKKAVLGLALSYSGYMAENDWLISLENLANDLPLSVLQGLISCPLEYLYFGGRKAAMLKGISN